MNGTLSFQGQLQMPVVSGTQAFTSAELRIPDGMTIDASDITNPATAADHFAGTVITSMMLDEDKARASSAHLFASAADTGNLRPRTLNPAPIAKLLFDGQVLKPYNLFLAYPKPIAGIATLEAIVNSTVKPIDPERITAHALQLFAGTPAAEPRIFGGDRTLESRALVIARDRMFEAINWANEFLTRSEQFTISDNDSELISSYTEAANLMRFLLALSISHTTDHQKDWVVNKMNNNNGWIKYCSGEGLTIDPQRFEKLFPAYFLTFKNAGIRTDLEMQKLAQLHSRRARRPKNIDNLVTAIAKNTSDQTLRNYIDFSSGLTSMRLEGLRPVYSSIPHASDADQVISSALANYIYIAVMNSLGTNLAETTLEGLALKDIYTLRALAESSIPRTIVGGLMDLRLWPSEMSGNVITIVNNIRDDLKRAIRNRLAEPKSWDLRAELDKTVNTKLKEWIG